MSSDAVAESGNSAGANGGGNPSGGDSVNVAALVNETVNKALGARLKRVVEEITTGLPGIIAAELAKVVPSKTPDAQQPASNDAGGEKLTLKALQEQIAKLNSGIDAERKARADAEQRERDGRMRHEVQTHFARHLGADSPHLRPYVNEYMPQFQFKDGAIVRKVTGEYGDEQFMPADKAVEELFKGDLKHLVQQSKAAQLPPTTFRNAQGQPFQIQAPANHKVNPILAEIATGIAKDRPELAPQLAQMAIVPVPQK